VIKFQTAELCTEVTCNLKAKISLSIIATEKTREHHPTSIPPEAPSEGQYSKESKRLGANFHRKRASISSFFVSWKQNREQALSSNLLRIKSHLDP
jgi:hypothetical protein